MFWLKISFSYPLVFTHVLVALFLLKIDGSFENPQPMFSLRNKKVQILSTHFYLEV